MSTAFARAYWASSTARVLLDVRHGCVGQLVRHLSVILICTFILAPA